MKQLSKRLNQLYDLITPDCDVFYDLCCDHGDIAIKVHLNYPNIKVKACDQVQSICNKLEEKISAYITKTNNFEIICASAADIHPNTELVNQFLIAGVGTNTTIEILKNITHEGAEFILSSHKNPWQLREFLNSGPFNLIKELVISDNGKFYQMLKVRHSLTKEVPVSLYGQEMWSNGAVSKQYYQHCMKYISTIPGHKYKELKDFLKNFNNDTIS